MNSLDFASVDRQLIESSVAKIILTKYSIYDFAMAEEIANMINRVIMKPVTKRIVN